ncbi:hypothetical protein [Calothrix sp. 336/3]|uniref:hypothetical protein n=1 Tax=Calothrix sp. 336/3 TaxID=1337936 RepID=UPI0004E3DB9D|nr:hypothetical protein [Calothrix sp. 336/3]AKG21178.1 hypothetical protein IJ00_07570 [Calothrix sp. 336/3]
MNKHFKFQNLILGLIVAATATPISFPISTSAETPTSCTSYIRGMFERFPSGTWFNVKATRITARTNGGFSSFGMAENYFTRDGVSTTAASGKEGFIIRPEADRSYFLGKFQDVFPGRNDGKSDLTTLKVYRDGRVRLVLNAWGNGNINLSDLACYPGHQGSTFVLTGNSRTASQGFDSWTFLISPITPPD